MQKMKRQIIAFISAFIISINCINGMSLTVCATSSTEETTDTTHGGGGGARPADTTSLTGFNNWPTLDKAYFLFDNLLSVTAGVCGVIFNPLNWNYENVSNMIRQHAYDTGLITSTDDYFDWVAECLSVNDNGELVVDDELADTLYTVTNVYLEENCGWYEWQSYSITSLYSVFATKTQYDYFVKQTEELSVDEYLCFYRSYKINGVCYPICMKVKYDGFVVGDVSSYSSKAFYEWEDPPEVTVTGMDNNGVELNDRADFGFTTNLDSPYVWNTSAYYNSPYFLGSGKENNAAQYSSPLIVTKKAHSYRIYKTIDDYKAYSVGTRPYYTTSKYADYVLSGDNSCVISQSDLSNGSVYGDVTNNIITIYEDADGLTEDELRRILDEYFDKIKDGDDGDSGSGSGSGSGLGALLDGLGTIGDVIMSILGKLLEYVGKALDLVGNTVTKVIDIIPQNITNLLGALFPFLPEEWLTAIELSLVLAVIIGIVGIFKK